MQTFIKNGEVKSLDVIGGKVVTTIKIDGRWVSNPQYADFIADGWQPYTLPAEERYRDRVVELIRTKYSVDDELARLRQKETKSKEYDSYFDYCEACKKQAYEEIYGKEAPADLAPKQD